MLITIRDKDGSIFNRINSIIDTPKSYVFRSEDYIPEHYSPDFIGSIEVEIFSIVDMVFPYPAFVLEYISKKGTTVVHTTGRIYNNLEDYVSNSDHNVAESGFDIYFDKQYQPFFCLSNGSKLNDGRLMLDITA